MKKHETISMLTTKKKKVFRKISNNYAIDREKKQVLR